MNYSDALNFLYAHAPMFQKEGKSAYKANLETSKKLDTVFNSPHKSFATVHVGGTNGKGSVSHLMAAAFQKSGYVVGLYTSPHLKSFTERIRINGQEIDQDYVSTFVTDYTALIEELKPSFFEIVTAMAFKYFADRAVDIAIIEVGLGGRLDCTNIIEPELAVITNISLDHTNILGPDLPSIAKEKAGIIKYHVPVVIGETQKETKNIFYHQALEMETTICFADKQTFDYPLPSCELTGDYQSANIQTAYVALNLLKEMGWRLTSENIAEGFLQVIELTGLQGRWQTLGTSPLTICDTGHNAAGLSYVVDQLEMLEYSTLRMVFGMVNDKDIEAVLPLLPQEATYYFVKADIPRGLDSKKLQEKALAHGLKGQAYASVNEGFEAAKKEALASDVIFVGGSNFTVAEVL